MTRNWRMKMKWKMFQQPILLFLQKRERTLAMNFKLSGIQRIRFAMKWNPPVTGCPGYTTCEWLVIQLHIISFTNWYITLPATFKCKFSSHKGTTVT